MSSETQDQGTHERAQEQVAATTDSYGGPASEDELAEVYLPDGQDEVKSGSAETPEPAAPGDDGDDEDPTEKASRLIVG